MSYDVVILHEAFRGIDSLLDELRAEAPNEVLPLLTCIHRELERLATDPVNLSRRSTVPGGLPAQTFAFACTAAAVKRLLSARFVYAENERELKVTHIGFQRMPPM